MKITEESLKEPKQQQPAPAPFARSEHQSEKEKLSSMNTRDRLWYIWTYYKFHIFAVVLVVFVAVSVGRVAYHNSFQTRLYCICVNSRGETEPDMTVLDTGFAEYLGLGKKELVTSELAYISYGDDATEFSYASMAKISALVASRELDVIIGDTDTLTHYSAMGGCLDLETFLEPELAKLVRDRFVFFADENGVSHACAIDLSGTAFAEETNLSQEPPLLCIISNSDRTDTAEALIRYVFQ